MIFGVNGKPVRRLADLTQELEHVGVEEGAAGGATGRQGDLGQIDVMDIGRRG